MIQRIQTIYLLIVTLLVTLCFFMPSAELVTGTGPTASFTMFQLIKGNAGKEINGVLAAITGISSALAFFAIFFYKKRKLQLTICLLLIALLILIDVVAFIDLQQLKKEASMIVSYKLPLVFPLISAILTYLAYRGIKKDEELVQSYDRLR